MYTHLYSEREGERETWRERVGDFPLCTHISIFRKRERERHGERELEVFFMYIHLYSYRERERHGETELEIFSVYTYLYSERERGRHEERELEFFFMYAHIYIHTEKERATGSPCSVLWDEVGSTVPRVGDRQILKVVLNPLG